ncbi:NrfD/PsrC family molybdoenzyme membrane anchor subunit [Natrialbaceae archaeon AArc-T1-2]|uniref:NrfD/PsrC family molybdoenzyme membrane anchor subunit n=1 Tax=Natrialbaceae archaeon AArc-T1-2 TaxID=3053904 RepID=UPI00255B081E|nr:NrfD/PsrC family molybdoenzyme membrane anchor subunit [Natrialbaceae archaeon AArc-T1-2]WIV66676.1 polysulfide reductase NrfD [Natrialbaceae archaeon AArc-T1-2]
MAVEIGFELPYTQWDWKVGFYIAMIGIASGAYLMGYVADVRSRRGERDHGRVAKWGYLTGLVGIGVGGPVLLSHLATPFRAMLVPLIMTNFGSWMAIGPYLLGPLALGALLMFVWVAFGRDRPHGPSVTTESEGVAADGGRDVSSDGGTDSDPARAATGGQAGGIRRIFNRAGILDHLDALADRTRPTETVRLGVGALFGIFAAGVLIYSAMAYGTGMTDRVPLWDKTFLIPVQVLSGLGAGLAVAVGLATLEDRAVGRTMQEYALTASGLLVATLVAVLATVALLPGQVPAAEPAVDNMLSTYATLFVGGAVLVGLVVPILLLAGGALGQRRGALGQRGAATAFVAAGVLVIVGKITLALTYLLAAEFTPLPLPM